ncbi:hypothetical protein [Streptomyces sp. NPDC096105]|uniref:hypothetical protein n=1 Tax=Streptomyces sp. NPDC096105 TaxID=3366074 RepID=UPI0037F55CE1
MSKRNTAARQKPARVFVLDSEALPLAVQGDRAMIARIDLVASGEAEVVTSPMTLIEAHDGRTTEQRWDWILSRLTVADTGNDEARQARQARRLLTDAGLHGHKYAIDAVLAVIARRQKGQVTVFTSDTDDLERLVPDTIVVKKV